MKHSPSTPWGKEFGLLLLFSSLLFYTWGKQISGKQFPSNQIFTQASWFSILTFSSDFIRIIRNKKCPSVRWQFVKCIID
jgi:hypothetical protein